MTRNDEHDRREAVRRVLAGEPVAAVAADLGRSQPWVRKWVERYDPADQSWAVSHSRAPVTVANRTDVETETLVLKAASGWLTTRGPRSAPQRSPGS